MVGGGGFWGLGRRVISSIFIRFFSCIFSCIHGLLVNMLYRYDAHSGGEREIQRTMLELLNQLDGFDSRGDVKVILATNRIESLDPALLRPGRIDRKIEFPLPDIKTRRRIFQVGMMTNFVKATLQMLFLLILCVILVGIFCLVI